jgi:ribosomal protein S4E
MRLRRIGEPELWAARPLDLGRGTKRRNAEHGTQSERNEAAKMKTKAPAKLRDGAQCKVIGGTHAGKFGAVRDIKTGKTGYVSITVVQSNGERFKTLAKNVVIQT